MSEEIKNVEVSEATSSEATISKSKAKREARAKEAKAEKTKKNTDNLLLIILGVIIGLVVVTIIGCGIYFSVKNAGDETLINSGNTTSSEATATDATSALAASAIPFSEGLTAEGFIEGLDLDKVSVPDFDSIVIPEAEVTYTEEDLEAELENLLSYFMEFSTDAALEVKDGDTINLDYVGSVDGVPFDGGNTEGNGTTLVIGSHTYIDNFEEQLIGSHPGDKVTVNVTFPENYGAEGTDKANLNGAAAVFECTVNSIQVKPELNDAFVVNNIAEYYGTNTVDELKAYIMDMGRRNNIQAYISSKVAEMVDTEYAPEDYVSHLVDLAKKSDKYQFENMNAYYMQMLGAPIYESFNDYTGLTDQEYDEQVKENALTSAKLDATFEAYFKAKNLTIADDVKAEVTDAFASQGGTAFYGEGYLNQIGLKYSVIDYLTEILEVK